MRFSIRNNTHVLILLFVASVIFYGQNLSLHGIADRDDEIFYYKSTQEMLLRGDILSPTYFGEDRFQKPILFYWMILASYGLWGVSWFAARFVSVVFAALTVCLTWEMARQFFDRRVAFLSGVILMVTPLFYRHAKIAVPDMALVFFIVLAVFAAMRFAQDPSRRFFWNLFYVSCALGFMVKGYAAVVIPVLTVAVHALATRQGNLLRRWNFPLGIALMALIIAPWFIYMLVLHGNGYLDYLLVHETRARLLSPAPGMMLVKMAMTFVRNLGFYLEVLVTYFAPWWLFALGAVPLAVKRIRERGEHAQGLWWMVTWVGVVMVFFSLVFVVINHYLLALATPFAILVASFFLDDRPKPAWLQRGIRGLFVFLLVFGFLGLAFLKVFLAGANKFWLVFYLLALVGLIELIRRRRDPMVAPMVAGLFTVFVLLQGRMMVRAGITPHPTLQGFAYTVSRDLDKDAIISVGSHDLHEKEWQVYFDRKIDKSGHSFEDCVRINFNRLFKSPYQVYCLILEKDYLKYKKEFDAYGFRSVREDFIFRKRFQFDWGFVAALARLDRETVHDYLKERVFLLTKQASKPEP